VNLVFARNEISAIAFGASAGGIEALSALLPALAPGLDVAVFVVLHQLRDRASLLPRIFAPKCTFGVCEPDDKQEVRSGSIYFAPPDYHMLIGEGPCIALSIDDLVHYSRPSIDVLFESAAEVYGRHLLAVVLSGGNADGADGAVAVQRAGGRVVVQDPQSARIPTMPLAVLDRIEPAAVLPVAGIVRLLASLTHEELI
jgi:two-component system chemotaxis response regulator CheB